MGWDVRTPNLSNHGPAERGPTPNLLFRSKTRASTDSNQQSAVKYIIVRSSLSFCAPPRPSFTTNTKLTAMEQTREHAGARMAPAETSGAMYERTQAVKHAHRPFVRVSVPRCAAPTSCRLRQPHHWTASQPALRPGSANFAARMTRRVRRAESSENAAGQLKAGERYAAALAGGLDRDTVALRRLVEDARFADPGFDVAGSDAAEALRPLGPAVEPNRYRQRFDLFCVLEFDLFSAFFVASLFPTHVSFLLLR